VTARDASRSGRDVLLRRAIADTLPGPVTAPKAAAPALPDKRQRSIPVGRSQVVRHRILISIGSVSIRPN
jgi:hypothetical protein